MAYTLGVGVASVEPLFPLVSAFLGWPAVFPSRSDTSASSLFGNLHGWPPTNSPDPVLMAATNASSGLPGKMISPQDILAGTSTTDCRGLEGAILARTFMHSMLLTLLLGVIVMLQHTSFRA